MNICVVGSGYVGLVAGACMSDFGMNVTCVDSDKSKIRMLKKGQMPIFEIGLSEIVQRNVKLGRLQFSSNLADAVDRSLVIFIGVGTPENDDGSSNLTQVRQVATEVARSMNDYKVIVIKSTVPVGTSRELDQLVKENLNSDVEFDIVSNPEFLREGTAVNDFLRPDRVVIGAGSERALAIVRDIYRPLYLLETPIVSTTNETAEMVKYASNTMLALKISFINEIANICDRVKADVYTVATAVGMDKRIGPKFLHPGPGFGGSCFPKDIRSLVNTAESVDYNFEIGKAVLRVNERQKELIVEKSCQLLGELKGKSICLLGLSFKPGTDDVREAPALHIARRLLEKGATVKAYDPAAMEQARRELPDITYGKDYMTAASDTDLVIIATEWHEFRDLDFDQLKSRMRSPNIYDTRNIYDPKDIRRRGFNYICTGRDC
ncbi:MAG: UDP-glucose/GDP-mannose dehydrogenase family protein [Candidatus Zixiibacteriota bacterium]|nr:MAG: UDP-glucose/GDP-mannose dehydrogenase family protein [candidate division Zixibacteria bacterium]